MKLPESMATNVMPMDVAARMLSKAGARQITDVMIRADVDAGTPTNPDGTLDLVHYAAWNVRQMAGGIDGA